MQAMAKKKKTIATSISQFRSLVEYIIFRYKHGVTVWVRAGGCWDGMLALRKEIHWLAVSVFSRTQSLAIFIYYTSLLYDA